MHDLTATYLTLLLADHKIVGSLLDLSKISPPLAYIFLRTTYKCITGIITYLLRGSKNFLLHDFLHQNFHDHEVLREMTLC